MTKKLRIIISVALVIALSLGIAVLTFSQDGIPTVTLDGNTRSFKFTNVAAPINGHVHAGNDLFPDMKNVMPGDVIEQKIIVRAENISSRETATIKLKVEPVDYHGQLEPSEQGPRYIAYNNFLNSEYVTLEVYNGDELLSRTKLSEEVVLGELKNRGSITLTVRLVIDKKAGNDDLAGLHTEVDWIFSGDVTESNDPGPGPGPNIPNPEVPLGLEKEDHFAYIIGRDDGLVHPGANITRAEVATIFFRMLTDESRAQFWSQTNTYSDVASDAWYNNAVSTLTKAGVLSGRTDGRFDPNAPITRAEFATIFSRFYDSQYDGPDKFSDIAGHWAADSINQAAVNNLLEGYPDGTFKPNTYISRAEAVTGMNRILGRAPHKDFLLPDMITWPDNSDTSAWYYAAMQEATNSHHYEMIIGDAGLIHEEWTELREVRDWAALETQWAALLGNRENLISSR